MSHGTEQSPRRHTASVSFHRRHLCNGHTPTRLTCASASKSRCTSPPADRPCAGRGDAPRSSPGSRLPAQRSGPRIDAHHSPRLGRRRRLSAMELQLPQLRRRAQRHAARATPRTQSSIAVRGDGDVDWVLVNASPDILAQIRAHTRSCSRRRALRDTRASRRRADGRADRSHHRPVHAARAPRAAAALVHRRRVCEDLTTRQSRCSTCSGTTAASTGTASPLDGSRVRRCRASRGLRFARAARCASKAPPYSPHRERPGARRQHRPADRRRPRAARALFYAPGLGAIDAAVSARDGSAPTACSSTARSGPTTR